MATKQERFDELDEEMKLQMDSWRARDDGSNHNQVIDVAEQLIHFMRNWRVGMAKNSEMP